MTFSTLELPVATIDCDEPDGVHRRSVYPMRLTPENLKTFWEKSRQYPTLFTSEIDGNFQKFAELFMSGDEEHLQAQGLFWVIDDFIGIFYMTHITLIEAQVHFTFFDGRLRGREELTKEMIKYVFGKFGLQRMNVEIPLYAKPHVFAFVERLGFKREGRKRAAIYYNNEWFDVNCYGVLCVEAESWELKQKKLVAVQQ